MLTEIALQRENADSHSLVGLADRGLPRPAAFYHPRVARTCCSGRLRTAIPDIASPNPLEASAIMAGFR